MYTSESINIKSQVINNIMLQMSMYIDRAAVDILQKVLEEQFVFLNVEQITTLPAEINRSTEEKNRYLAGLYQVKKRNLSRETMEQYMRAIKSLAAVIDKPYTEMDELDIDYYLQCYEQRNVSRTGKKNQASTVNNERRYLSAFFTWLRKNGLIKQNKSVVVYMKVYVTKFALESGILECEVDSVNEFGSVYVANSPYDNDRYAHEGEWFTDRQAAIDKAYQMRFEAVQNLYLKIEQLMHMEF